MDDNAESLRVLPELDGYRVDVRYDGWAVLDIGLPGMNGFEVARRLRNDPGLVGVCLVAISGYGAEEDRRRSQAAGFDHHWVKPVDVAALQGILGTPPPLA